jgi:hypothetical protein
VRAKQVGTGFAVRAAALTGGMLGQTVRVGRPRAGGSSSTRG